MIDQLNLIDTDERSLMKGEPARSITEHTYHAQWPRQMMTCNFISVKLNAPVVLPSSTISKTNEYSRNTVD